MPIQRNVDTAESTGEGRQHLATTPLTFPDAGAGRFAALVGVLEETFDHDDFTDGGGDTGTIQFTGSLPAGALVVASRVLVPEGFAGDVSAVLTIGDGDDADRYNTGTVDVFSTAADGVEAGLPSGALLVTEENRPTLSVTVDADWGSVSAGQVTVAIYYIQA